MNVSCVLVTRGDVALEPILDSIPIDDIVIWNNADAEDKKVFGRYAAIDECRHKFIYTQDDDCICPVLQILSAYTGDGLLVNAPEEEHPFLGWGAIFPRELPFQAFRYYLEQNPWDDQFLKWCDVVFAELSSPDKVDFGHEDLPCATATNRMYHESDHYTSQQEVRDRCQNLLASPW